MTEWEKVTTQGLEILWTIRIDKIFSFYNIIYDTNYIYKVIYATRQKIEQRNMEEGLL